MSYFKITIIDFIANIHTYIIFLIEKTLILLLLFFVINDVTNVISAIHKINTLDGDNIYLNNDLTDSNKITQLFGDSNSIEKMRELYNYVSENFTKYSYWEYPISENSSEELIIQATTDLYFFNLFDIKVVSGRLFNEQDIEANDSFAPVIIGYNLRNKYELNKTYEIYDPNTGLNKPYKIIGILKQGESYPGLLYVGASYNLDNRLLKILTKKDLNDFPSLDMALGSLVIFSKSENDVKKIEAKSVELDLFDMNFIKASDNSLEFIKEVKSGLIKTLMIIIIFITILILTGINRLTLIIKTKINDYINKMICGATLFRIHLEFLFQFILIDIIASIPIVIYIINGNTAPLALILAQLFNLIVNIIIILISYYRLKKKNLISLRKE